MEMMPHELDKLPSRYVRAIVMVSLEVTLKRYCVEIALLRFLV